MISRTNGRTRVRVASAILRPRREEARRRIRSSSPGPINTRGCVPRAYRALAEPGGFITDERSAGRSEQSYFPQRGLELVQLRIGEAVIRTTSPATVDSTQL